MLVKKLDVQVQRAFKDLSLAEMNEIFLLRNPKFKRSSLVVVLRV
jgi:hypothetical protein